MLQQLLQYLAVSNSIPKIFIPKEALAEFATVERSDWSKGVQLEQLLGWINWVAERFRPAEIGESSRSSEEFTARSFRHYQTLGCIDPPERVGRGGIYRFRQYLQALLIRKLIWERVPSAQIASLMKGRSNDELKRLLFEGIEIVPGDASQARVMAATKQAERWQRLELMPGLELHAGEQLAPLSPKDLRTALQRIQTFLESL